ncbi:Pre-rRNA-processing protein las1 [Picochlorum sp. SENEW3]|nr:Pre-rRNA-processing protein las1 [Picochlorum sp. SENEW3]WPT15810.1 Pre-rRNA-processing protein las1 [Picochlorum sp. SENEW3]
MSLGRLVPWMGWDEWETVGKCLYDDTALSQGLDIVSVWRIRGRVPVGVDATALLRETQQADRLGSVSDALIRLQYSLALVRFVNGVADSAQKGRVASSVAHLAQQAGIPRILVDIRHESTHNELPSLSVLRVAAKQALEWLRTKYWQAQRTCLADSEASVRDVMNTFIDSHIAVASRGIFSGHDDDSDGNGEKRPNTSDNEEYDVRKEKKHRQSLFTELRTSVPKGEEKILVQTMMLKCVSVEFPEHALRRACSRVLTHLLGEWPDVHCMIVRMFLDQRFESSDTVMSRIWMEESLDTMSPGNIDAVMLDVMIVQGPLLRQRHIEAFVEGREDENLNQTLNRLRETFDTIRVKGSLTPACRRRVEEFAAVFFTMPTTSEALDTMKRINDDDDDGMIHNMHHDAESWTRVDAWTPCAIGMMPSPEFCMNGRLPDMQQLDVTLHDTLAMPLESNMTWCPNTHCSEDVSTQDSDKSLEETSNQEMKGSDASEQQGPPDSSLGACPPPVGLSFKPTR